MSKTHTVLKTQEKYEYDVWVSYGLRKHHVFPKPEVFVPKIPEYCVN